jgi:hypothetical protein
MGRTASGNVFTCFADSDIVLGTVKHGGVFWLVEYLYRYFKDV